MRNYGFGLKNILRAGWLVVLAMGIGLEARATNYCETTLTGNNEHEIRLSCEQISAGNYRLTITSDDPMSGLYNNSWIANVNGANYQMGAVGNFTLVNAYRIVADFASSTTPADNFYSGLCVTFTTGSDLSIFTPTAINWSHLCAPYIVISSTVASANGITLNWTPENFASNPTQYTVEYSSDGGVNWTTASTTATSPYTITGLTLLTDYKVRVSGTSGLENGTGLVDVKTSIPLSPTPPHLAANVKTVFSSTYGNRVANWSSYPFDRATVVTLDASHNALKYSLGGGVGNPENGASICLSEGGGTTMDITTSPVSEYVHFDVYIPDDGNFSATSIRLRLNETNPYYNIPQDLTIGTWNSFDVPLSVFTGFNSPVNRIQIVPCVNAANNTYPSIAYDLYVDNIYFYAETNPVIRPTISQIGCYSIGLNWTTDNFAVNPSAYTVEYSANGGASWTTASTTATSPYTVRNLNQATSYTFRISATSGLESASATILKSTHADVNSCTPIEVTPTAGEIPDQLLSLVAQKESNTSTLLSLSSSTSTLTGVYELVMQNAGGGTYTGYTYALDAVNNTLNFRVAWSSYPTGNIQVHLVARRSQAGGGSDIIGYTFSGLDVSAACPRIPAPPVVQHAENVTQHLYVSDYQNVANINMNRLNFYSQSTGSVAETEGGYNVLKFVVSANPDAATVQVHSTNGNLVDISNNNYMHVDIYIPNDGSFTDHMPRYVKFGLDEQRYDYQSPQIALDQWNSFDIPLSAWGNNINLSDMRAGGENCFSASLDPVYRFTNTQPNAPYTLYVDNWYFYKLVAISDLAATTTYNSATLSWTPLYYTVNPSAYTVEYSSDGGENWTTASTEATSPYTVTGLLSGIDYAFRVTGTSGLESANATVEALTNLPLPPTYTYLPANVLSARSTQYGRTLAGALVYTTYCNVSDTVSSAIDASHKVLKATLGGLTRGNADGGGNTGARRGVMWRLDNLGALFSNYSNMHVDIFIPDNAVTRTFTKLRIRAQENDGHQVDITDFTLNAWNSIDIPVSAFTLANTTRFCMVPMVGDGYPASTYTLYIDNFIFYNVPAISLSATTTTNSATLTWSPLYYNVNPSTYTVEYSVDGGSNWTEAEAGATSPYTLTGLVAGNDYLIRVTGVSGLESANAVITATTAIPLPPTYSYDSGDVLSARSSQYGRTLAGASVYTTYCNVRDTSSVEIDASHKVLRNNLGGLSYGNANGTGNHGASRGIMWQLDNLHTLFGDYQYVHVDLFIPDNAVTRTFTKMRLKADENDNNYVDVDLITLNAWNSFDIPVVSFGKFDVNRFCMVPMVGNSYPATDYTMYLDNFFLYRLSSAGCDATPAEAAPVPTLPSEEVLSLFGDTYDAAVASFETNNGVLFGVTGVAELVQVETGNYAYKYEDQSRLVFQVTATRLPVKMNGLSFDIWAERPMTIHVRAGQGDFSRDLGTYDLECGWNTVLAHFTETVKSWLESNNFGRMDIQLAPLADTYIDNMYFYTSPLTLTITKRLAAQGVCRVKSDASIRRIQLYSNDLSVKYVDESFVTPVEEYTFDIRTLPTGTYKVLVYDATGRVADVKAVHVVY